ncbi:MAG: hypothetical protein JW914_01035 [Syntrophaceae bacterium]|nr:hypothetical protein [Syntrophaceae bacterium]
MNKQIIFPEGCIIQRNIKTIHFVIIALFVLFANNALAESKDANPYQGIISGQWSGNIQGAFMSGTFSMKIAADGALSGSCSEASLILGSKPVAIAGNVSSDGNLKAESEGGITAWKWDGKLAVSGGRISGSGLFTGSGSNGNWYTE